MTSHLPGGKAGAAQLTREQLRAALQAALTDAEQRSLRAGDGAFCVNAFNRAVLLRWPVGPGAGCAGGCRRGRVPRAGGGGRGISAGILPGKPRGAQGHRAWCLARTFLEQRPMHPQAAARWRETAGG